MPSYTTSDIRNIALVGHGLSGKTSLVDAMLAVSGTVTRRGSVSSHDSYSDFEKEEKDHGHSIFSAVLQVDHLGHRINVIDTPGSPDLIGQAIAVLPAVETVVVVVNAQNGIEVMTRRMMQLARERNLARAIVVNKIDSPGVKLPELVAQLQEAFGPECLPVNLPTGNGKAVVECLLNNAGESDFDSVRRAHARILDQIVEMDENLMEKYLGGQEPDYAALHEPFERAMDEGHVVPIVFTDAKTGVGMAEFLDTIVKHYPSPLEAKAPVFLFGEGKDERELMVKEDAGAPLMAHVFKVTSDPFVGKLAIFRVHQGRCTGQSQIIIGHSKKPVKLGHVFHLQGKEHRETKEIITGDIGCVAKIEEIHLNDILHDDHALDAVHVKPLSFPTPMYGLAINPKSRGDETKLSTLLTKLAEEDPTFTWHTDRQTHEVVISGVGELHLRFALERLAHRGVHVDTKPPKIAYRETISSKAEGHYRHKKQSGGAGQFGEVYLRIEPLEPGNTNRKDAGGAGFEFVDEIFGGTIPGQFVPAVEKGVRDVLEQGPVAGFPVQDVRVIVYDGKHHPVDSKEIAFRTAGKYAFKDAILKARPVLLEPVVTMNVTVPQDKLGSITGDLSGKRGRIHGQDFLIGGMAVVKAEAPLAEVMQYQSQLKSVTGGQGSFVMEFSHYEPVPAQVQVEITKAYKPVIDD